MARTSILPPKVSYTWGEDEGKVFLPSPNSFAPGDVWPAGTVVRSSLNGTVEPAISGSSAEVIGGQDQEVVGVLSEKFTADRYSSAVDGFSQKTVVGHLIVPGTMIAANVGFDDAGNIDPVVDETYMFKQVFLRKNSDGTWVYTCQAMGDLPGTPSDALAFQICSLISKPGTVNGRVLAMPLTADPYMFIPNDQP